MESLRELFRIGHGPSSSHTIGPERAARRFLGNHPGAARYRATLYGSLALTGRGHGTDRAIARVFPDGALDVAWRPEAALPRHPNGLELEALDADGATVATWRVYSTGGGAIRDDADLDAPPEAVYPVESLAELIVRARDTGRALWHEVGEREGEGIWAFLEEIRDAMDAAVDRGLEADGVLPGPLRLARKAGSYLARAHLSARAVRDPGTLFAYALAVAEENAAGGLVVTAPTCGSAGVLPAVLRFLSREAETTPVHLLRALATAGLIGNLVKRNASISGAEVGCQGEIGVACAMAAGAAAQVLGGTPAQVEYAAEMGLEHHLGLTCDPVGGFVQIPCIERNAMAAVRALECAVFALLGDGTHRVPFDEVVHVMARTGRDLDVRYRETALGGLAGVVR